MSELIKIKLTDLLNSDQNNILNIYYLWILKFQLLDQKNFLSYEDGLNSLIYGIQCWRVKNGSLKRAIIYQIEPNSNILTLIKTKSGKFELIDLLYIYGISFFEINSNLKKCLEKNDNFKLKKNHSIHFIFFGNSYDFIFDSIKDLTLFLCGIISLFENYIYKTTNSYQDKFKELYFNLGQPITSQNIKYFDNLLNLNIDIYSNNIVKFLYNFENKYISFKNFISLFDVLFDGEIYKYVFNPYINIFKDFYNITFNDFCSIITKIQKDIDLTKEELLEIMINYKTSLTESEKNNLICQINSNKNLFNEISYNLKDIIYFFYSDICNILDYFKLNMQQNELRPLNDYFINSTHNTYLTGHQLISDSLPQMYSNSVINGYRLVELDCYNGSDDNIIITHGYTLCTKINLKDILLELKAYAFLYSDYPIILSIENHLDNKHQVIMAKLFKSILSNIFILDQENLPEEYPNLKDLKNKFIIKCSGLRKLIDRTKIIPRSQRNYEDNSSIYINNIILEKFNLDNNLNNELKNIHINNEDETLDEDEENNIKYITLKDFGKSSNYDDNLKLNEELDPISEDEEDINNIDELNKVRGMFGTKFKKDKVLEMNYQPWEFVTVKSTKYEKYSKSFENRKQIINFTQNSFMKIYPQSFDSKNYDIVKFWIMGVQICALNIQKVDDDFVLLNKIFFKGNRNSGYIVKPKKLLPESVFYEDYKKKKGKVNFELISLLNIYKLILNEELEHNSTKKIILESYIVGSFEDDENNSKQSIEISGNFLFKKIYGNFNFDLYETDLSFIFFKLYYDNKIIGKSVVPVIYMKEGFRNIIFYDNKCIEIPECRLLVIASKQLF